MPAERPRRARRADWGPDGLRNARERTQCLVVRPNLAVTARNWTTSQAFDGVNTEG